jgi:transposase
VEIEVLPPEVQRKGLDAFTRVGQEVREVLERRPASMVVVRIVRPKFVERTALQDECLAAGKDVALTDESGELPRLIAEPPELPIERGLAGPGMLADTIVRRWQDHLPLYRLALIYARDGLMLARSTMCGWHEQLADLAEPLVEAMLRDAFTAPYLCTDATGVLVQAKEQCRRAHFWVLIAPERHVLYRYLAQARQRRGRPSCSPATRATSSPTPPPSTTTCTRTATWSRSHVGRIPGGTSSRRSARSPSSPSTPSR